MSVKIGLVLFTVKDKIKEEGLYTVIKKCQDIGINTFEISAIEMSRENVNELERCINELGIDIVATSVEIYANKDVSREVDYDLETNFEKIVSDCKKLDARYVRIGHLPYDFMGNPQKYKLFAEDMTKYSTLLKKEGIKLLYHNHHFEFEQLTEKKTGFDILVENSDKDNVAFEIDVHWTYRGGYNPVDVITSLNNRVDVIHLKDYRVQSPKVLSSPGVMFPLMVQVSEIGLGTLDFNKIIKAAVDSNTKYLIIEQDDTYGRNVYESLEISCENLKKLGYGQYFN